MDLQRDTEQAAPLPAPPDFLPPALAQTYDLTPGALYSPVLATPLAPGQLTPAWRTLFIAGWVGVVLGFAAVWQASRVSGIAPWWLGPETNQRAFAVIAIPFIAPIVAVGAGIAKLRTTCYIGIAAAIVTIAVALGDRNRFAGIAAIEGFLAIAGLLISVGALAGRMRRPT